MSRGILYLISTPASRLTAAALVIAALTIGVACGSTGTAGQGEVVPAQLRLGYLANLTHAGALVGVRNGYFADAIGSPTQLKTSVFNAGPDAQEALLSDSVDAAFIGPNPAINSFVQSHGQAIRIVAGATSGGASLVVKPSISVAADLRGKTIASPQLGNTQDISLRWWLKQQGLQTTVTGGGDVRIQPQDNATTLQTFRAGQIDGAWVPEPWATRLVLEGGGKVLVNEASLWPDGQFATTLLAVRTDFLQRHPTTVRHLLEALVRSEDYLTQHPTEAQGVANQAIADITSKPLAGTTIAAAWKNLTFSVDPVAASLRADADHATRLGLLPATDLKGIYDLRILNLVLAAAGRPPVSP
jgi:NitT/TauT family transport system substrate-binding protein